MQVLTAIVDGIKSARPDATRLAATKALMNSLDLCGENFKREGERNMLMTVTSCCSTCFATCSLGNCLHAGCPSAIYEDPFKTYFGTPVISTGLVVSFVL